MDGQVAVAPVVRRAGEGDKRWFFGGGVWTWKASGADGAGGLVVVDVEMDARQGDAAPHAPHRGVALGPRGAAALPRRRRRPRARRRRLRDGAGRHAARVPGAGRSGARADDPALGRLRGVLPRGERAARGFGPRDGLRAPRAERPAQRRDRDPGTRLGPSERYLASRGAGFARARQTGTVRACSSTSRPTTSGASASRPPSTAAARSTRWTGPAGRSVTQRPGATPGRAT